MSHQLSTERLNLRRFAADDADWVARALADADVARWVPLLPYPYGMEDAQAFVTLQSGPNRNALAVLEGDVPIGCITTVTELGYWFIQSAWGKGFATEACRAIVGSHFGRETDPLQSGYMVDNSRSYNVLAKLGFQPTEKVVRRSTMSDEDVTIQRMTLSKADWEARAA